LLGTESDRDDTGGKDSVNEKKLKFSYLPADVFLTE